jgi:mRNA-degrading endonuclease HigB of HigAB toxin-antitoxin module
MMQIFGKSRLESFAQEHEDSRAPLVAWQLEAEEGQWSCPEEVQARYANAVVQPDRIIFDIKSLYKIHVKAKFNQGVLLIDKVWAIATPKPVGRVSRTAAIRSKA